VRVCVRVCVGGGVRRVTTRRQHLDVGRAGGVDAVQVPDHDGRVDGRAGRYEVALGVDS